MTISAEKFGDLDGKRVDQFRLVSDTGVEVDLITYGVVVRDWRVPVAGGKRSVVLGFDDFASYPKHSPYFGTLAGRVANRIGGAKFSIGGKEYQVPANDGRNSLHGGPEGIARQVWAAEADSTNNAVRFTLSSPDGASGYPGNVDFSAVYALRGNTLRLELGATADQTTPISLVQHQYFNLGNGADVLDHRYQVTASAYTELNDELIATGAILPVAGTPYDFRTAKTMLGKSAQPTPYDFNLVLDADRDQKQPVAVVNAPEGDLTFRLWTDQPGVQVYNSVYTNVKVPGLGGHRYGHHSGFCLEDQAFPNAVHHPHFPSIWYGPDRPYSHWCEIEIA